VSDHQFKNSSYVAFAKPDNGIVADNGFRLSWPAKSGIEQDQQVLSDAVELVKAGVDIAAITKAMGVTVNQVAAAFAQLGSSAGQMVSAFEGLNQQMAELAALAPPESMVMEVPEPQPPAPTVACHHKWLDVTELCLVITSCPNSRKAAQKLDTLSNARHSTFPPRERTVPL
jgi:hypothetical protein